MAKHHELLDRRERKAVRLARQQRYAEAADEWEYIRDIANLHNEIGWYALAKTRIKMLSAAMAKQYRELERDGHHFEPLRYDDDDDSLSPEQVFK